MDTSPVRASPTALKRVIRVLAAGLIALVVAGVVAGMALIRSSDETTNAIHEIVDAVASESTEVTNAYLNIAESAGRMTARSLAESDGILDDQVLQSTLKNVVATNPNIDGAFVGLPTGDFLYVTKSLAANESGFRIKRIENGSTPDRLVTESQTDAEFSNVHEATLLDDAYDPRTRPWYAAALERTRGWTAPYEFSSSGLPGITHFLAVESGGDVIGVVGIDVRLNELTSFLAERHPSDHGHALIIDDNGAVIATGSAEGMTRDRLRQLAATSAGLDPMATVGTSWGDDGDLTVAAVARIGADRQWTLAVVAPQRDFLSGLGSQPDRVRTFLPLVGLLLAFGVASASVSANRRIDRLHVDATTDPLTGILNRTEVRIRLAEVLDAEPDIDLAVVAIDLDEFGAINDAWGHDVGDQVLVGMTSRLVDAVGTGGFAGRIGGDEFLATVRVGPSSEPEAVVEEIVAAVVSDPFTINGVEIELGVSCGFCLRPGGELVGQLTLLRNADLALLTAKANKPNIVQFDPHMVLPSLRDGARHDELVAAVDRGEFEIHFQPEVDITDGSTVGAEALLRWRQGESKLLTAEAFIDDLERLGIVDMLTPALIDATTELAGLVTAARFTMRVNLSAGQLRNHQTLDAIGEAHRNSKVNWCVEITERTIVESHGSTLRRLERLVNQGVELALDDFGTGYSSFAELTNLPITTIKIDRSFVASLTAETAATSLASVIYDMADRLSLGVVAEGIETDEQRLALCGLGCSHGQGYLFGKAVPLAEFVATSPSPGVSDPFRTHDVRNGSESTVAGGQRAVSGSE